MTTAIIHRPLTRSEAQELHQELKTTPNILGYTVRELLRLNDVQVAEVEQQFAGACWSIDLAQGWTEIAALYVLPEFRGRGLGKSLFRAAWERVQRRERHIYVLSRNPQVVEWMKKLGMTVNRNLWCAPLAVHWYMQWYMASWYRVFESVRKHKEITRCPRLVQGMMRHGQS